MGRIRCRSELTTVTTRAPKKAGQKPLTWKPTPKAEATHPVIQNMKALIRRLPSPRVRISIGQDRSFRTGRTKVFISPKTAARINRAGRLWCWAWIPGISRKAAQMAAALIS